MFVFSSPDNRAKEDYAVQQEGGIRQGGWLKNKKKSNDNDDDDFSTSEAPRRVVKVDRGGSPKRFRRAIAPDSQSEGNPSLETLQFIRNEVIKRGSGM